MNIWNWWLITKAVKGVCLENNLDLVEIIVQQKMLKNIHPNAIDFVHIIMILWVIKRD